MGGVHGKDFEQTSFAWARYICIYAIRIKEFMPDFIVFKANVFGIKCGWRAQFLCQSSLRVLPFVFEKY